MLTIESGLKGCATVMGNAGEISRRRVAAGLVVGHLAAAYSFTASGLLLGAIMDPAAAPPHALGRWWHLLENLAFAPFEATIIGFLTFFMMLPASLLTAPFTYFAARKLRAEMTAALAIGAVIGGAEVGAFLAYAGGFRGPWSRPGLPGDPRTDIMLLGCGMVAGLSYAGVVWCLCIRPRLS